MKQILLPGGELQQDVLTYLNKVGIDVQFKPRCYRAIASNLPVEFVIVRASSIPDLINDPNAKDIIGGITGSDILLENKLALGAPLPIAKIVSTYKAATLFVGVTKKFQSLGNNSVSALSGYTVATKYPSLARSFFLSQNIPVSIMYVPGKDEAIPYLYTDVVGIFGLKKTENTMKANEIVCLQTVTKCSVNWIKRSQDQLTSQIETVLLDGKEVS